MSVLLFLGFKPDGWVCPNCQLYFAPNDEGKPADKPLAHVL